MEEEMFLLFLKVGKGGGANISYIIINPYLVTTYHWKVLLEKKAIGKMYLRQDFYDISGLNEDGPK